MYFMKTLIALVAFISVTPVFAHTTSRLTRRDELTLLARQLLDSRSPRFDHLPHENFRTRSNGQVHPHTRAADVKLDTIVLRRAIFEAIAREVHRRGSGVVPAETAVMSPNDSNHPKGYLSPVKAGSGLSLAW